MEQSTRTSYRLPGGKRTTYSIQQWEEEWNKLFAPFEKLGFVIHAFDPGIRMSHKDNPTTGAHVTITVDFAQRIGAALNATQSEQCGANVPVSVLKSAADPCPKCPKGTVCRTITCGRLARKNARD